MPLTDRTLKTIKPTGRVQRIYDGSRNGFGVQVSKAGAVSFIQRYSVAGKQRQMVIGRYPGLSLAKARKKAEKARNLVADGIDPREDQRQRQEAEEAAKRRKAALGTVADLFDCYIEQMRMDGKRSADQVRGIYDRHIDCVIGSMRASEVTPRDVARVLYPMKKRGIMVTANRTRSYLIAAFKFGIEWDLSDGVGDGEKSFELRANPARDVPKPMKKEKPCDRYLTESEIRAVWPALGDPEMISLQVGTVLRLILATGGQRVEEVLRADWSEFDLEGATWELPAARTKADRAHVVPLAGLALDLLRELGPTPEDRVGLLFPLRGRESEPMETNSLGNAVRKFCARLEGKGAGVAKFTARDLRRTVKTQMGRLGVSKEIRDRLQNHALTDVSSRHYDRHDYLQEKEQAAHAWDRALRAIIDPDSEPTNVIQLRKAAETP